MLSRTLLHGVGSVSSPGTKTYFNKYFYSIRYCYVTICNPQNISCCFMCYSENVNRLALPRDTLQDIDVFFKTDSLLLFSKHLYSFLLFVSGMTIENQSKRN